MLNLLTFLLCTNFCNLRAKSMTTYNPPLQDMQFLLQHVLDFQSETMDFETIGAVLEEAAKLSRDVLAPLNKVGDEEGTKLNNGVVTTALGFKEAYAQYRDGGWNAVPFEEEFGGQGLPWAIAFPIQEMWQGANLSFGLCPLLNQGAVEAILSHGSQAQKEFYLPKLISGEWTGTMNLTESQAGSDLGLIRSKAERQSDGNYKISGQKIFITYGEHDMADNIIHLVLARCTDAPDDVKGISLFIVPKFLESGERNKVQCIGIEHKLGIHASPTCTMEFSGAIGYLIGEENQGVKYMFTMMNNARLSVGLQGVAIAERATQAAQAYANERVQGKSFTSGKRVPIAEHADVKRMLLTMRALTDAGRALNYEAAVALGNNSVKVDLLTPIVKSWCTDMAVEVASIGIQIHGGMGFVEETGAAQYLRDARILPIYEGTNGIQAADLAFRKIIRDDGNAAIDYISTLQFILSPDHKEAFMPAMSALENAIRDLVALAREQKSDQVAWASVPLLKAFGYIAAGALLSKSSEAAKTNADSAFAERKAGTAEFYVRNILPFAVAHLKTAF